MNTFAISKIFVIKFCQMMKLTVGMDAINKATDAVEKALVELMNASTTSSKSVVVSSKGE